MATFTMDRFFDRLSDECGLSKTVLVHIWMKENYLSRLVMAFKKHNLDPEHDWQTSTLFTILYVSSLELVWYFKKVEKCGDCDCDSVMMKQLWRAHSPKPAHPEFLV